MAFGIKVIQDGVVLALGTSTHPAPITVDVGRILYFSFTGTTLAYHWAWTNNGDGQSVLSSTSSPGPTAVTYIDGAPYSLELLDSDGNVYVVDIVTPTVTPGTGPTGVATYVTTIASLRTITGVTGSTAIVRCYSVLGDKGGGVFIWREVDSASPLAADDNGLNVRVSGVTTGWWERQYSGIIDTRWFGAKSGYGVALTDVALTSSSTTLTSSSAAFSATDIGKLIAIQCRNTPATGTVNANGTTTLAGSSTLYLSELTVGQCIVVNGVERWVRAVASNVNLTLDAAASGGAGLVLYRKTVFEANVAAVTDAHTLTLSTAAPTSVSSAAAFYDYNSYSAWVSAIAVNPMSLHLVGEQSIKGAPLDPSPNAIMIRGDGWSSLAGQNGFGAASLSTTRPVDGSVLRVFGGFHGIVTTTQSYRALVLKNVCLLGSGVLNAHGLYPTNGDTLINSNEHCFDKSGVINFHDGWRVTNSIENNCPQTIFTHSCINGLHLAGPTTNSEIRVNAQGCHRGIYIEDGTAVIGISGLSQANYEGITLRPNDPGGLEEIKIHDIHCEGNVIPLVVDTTTGPISDLVFSHYHDFSAFTFTPTIVNQFTRWTVGDGSKLGWTINGYAGPMDWTFSNTATTHTIPNGGTRVNLNHVGPGINARSDIMDVMTYAATVTPDWTHGEVHQVTLTGNLTLNVPTNSPNGSIHTFIFRQDPTGGRTVTLAAGYVGGAAFDNTGNTANRYAAIQFYQIGTGTLVRISPQTAWSA